MCPLDADLFRSCHERLHFIKSLTKEKRSHSLQLNKANASDTEVAFVDLNL